MPGRSQWGGAGAALAAALACAALALAAGQSAIPATTTGAYLGCFALEMLPVDVDNFARMSKSSISKCMPYCGGQSRSLHAISPKFNCWCFSSIPDEAAQLPERECESGGLGVAVFYRHKGAQSTRCRLAPVPLRPDSFAVHYNAHNVEFAQDPEDGAAVMKLRQVGADGTRLATTDGDHLHGQYEVTAKVTNASGVVTAFYIRSTDVYTLSNDDSPFHEIDVELMNGNPAEPNSIWLNSYMKGLSGGEALLRPADYQRLLNLPRDATTGSTWMTYGFSWQPDYVVWYLNGTPLLHRKYDQPVSWQDMVGRPYSRPFRPPSEPCHLSFSVWSDGNQTRAFGGKLDLERSPFQSSFKSLRRILCDEPLPSTAAEAAAALGPSWLYGPPSQQPTKQGTQEEEQHEEEEEQHQQQHEQPEQKEEQSAPTVQVASVAPEPKPKQAPPPAPAPEQAAPAEQQPEAILEQAPSSLDQAPSTVPEAVQAAPAAPQPEAEAEQAPSPAAEQAPSPAAEQAPSPAAEQAPSPAAEQAPSPAAESEPQASLADIPAGGGTLATLSIATASSGPGPQAHCLEPWRGGGHQDDGLVRLGAYPCSSASPLWVYDKKKKTVSLPPSRTDGAGGCLTDVSGEPVVTACSLPAPRPQQWRLAGEGRLRSLAGACLGLGGPEARPFLTGVPCDSPMELIWRAGESDILSFLRQALPLTTSNPEPGYCLAAAQEAGDDPFSLAPGPLAVRPCLPPGAGTADNPTWYFAPGTRQILRSYTQLCLTASPGGGVELQPCARGGTAVDSSQQLRQQQWSLTRDGELRNVAGACIGVGGGGALAEAACGGPSEAHWAFGGESLAPLNSLNPNQTLGRANGGGPAVLDVVVSAELNDASGNTVTTSYVGLRDGAGGGLAWTFRPDTQQIAAADEGGKHAGTCLTARDDVGAVQLMQCEDRSGQHFRAQQWVWQAGELKDLASGKCLALAGDDGSAGLDTAAAAAPAGSGNARLMPVQCSDVAPHQRVTWKFGG